MLVLGFESTCDETACSVVRDGHEILSNVISSQTDIHKNFGGVVPELACRRHVDIILPTLKRALEEAQVSLEDIDIIAVAKGPGLIGALLIGLNAAKALSFALNKLFIGVNHIEAHLYAAMMGQLKSIRFPALGVILSGGHTALVHISGIGEYKLLGTTVDDAIGEAFDKVATILGFSYPGGPLIEQLAKEGDPYKYAFNAGQVKQNPLHFSFSGLKTNVLYAVKGQNSNKHAPVAIPEEEKKHIAASFQRAAFSDIVNKTLIAADRMDYHAIILGGGVCANLTLRKMFEEVTPDLPTIWPPSMLSCDNAAMIAGLAYQQFIKFKASDDLSLKAMTRITF